MSVELNVQTKEETKTAEEAEKESEQQEESLEAKEIESAEANPEEKIALKPLIFALCLTVVLILGTVLGLLFRHRLKPDRPVNETLTAEKKSEFPEWITEVYLTEDGISRTGEKMPEVLNIAVHYVANPGSSAMANRNYFEGPDSTTSSHFIVGLEGEVLLLIPLDEKSCATNERNIDTISVEVCHPDETGKFAPATYDSLIRLLAYLCDRFGLVEEELIRHYDVTGKMCPRYYVEHEDAWVQLKADVKKALEEGDFRD